MARSKAASGSEAEAAGLFREALSQWRGPALAGLTGRSIEAAAARLDEEPLATLEECFDLELRLGRHQALVPELIELMANHPMRDCMVGQLMLALYRCGRQAESLLAYQRLRERLVEDVGVDPSQELQALHLAILSNKIEGAARQIAVETPADDVVHRQLPTAVRHFTGRVAELKKLAAVMGEAERGNTVNICAITGTVGIGKTALALYWAHRTAKRFPDGQIYLNLRVYHPSGSPMTPAEAIGRLLDALGRISADFPDRRVCR